MPFIILIMLTSCEKKDKSSTKIELKNWEIVHSSSSFIIMKICIDEIEYLASYDGGLIRHGECKQQKGSYE